MTATQIKSGDTVRVTRRLPSGRTGVTSGTVVKAGAAGGFALHGVDEGTGESIHRWYAPSDDPYLIAEGGSQTIEIITTRARVDVTPTSRPAA